MMIYAILAVEYFAPMGQDFGEYGTPHEPGYYVTFGDEIDGKTENHTISAETPRGFTYGWEYYGTFTRALFTLFQVMTGESWSEAVARPLIFGLYRNAIFVSIFFVSFIMLTQIVLTNVIVAVLLDKFVEDPTEGDDEPPPQIDASDFLGGDDDSAGTTPNSRAGSPVPGRYSTAGERTFANGLYAMPSDVIEVSLAPQQTTEDFVGKTADEKLSLLLVEISSLRMAVGRCEAGIAELRAGQSNPSKVDSGRRQSKVDNARRQSATERQPASSSVTSSTSPSASVSA